MTNSVSMKARLYASMRTKLAPLGPALSRAKALQRAIHRLDGRVLPEGEVLVSTKSGWSIHLNARDQAVARTIIATGEWQPEETGLIVNALPVGGVAIDVGANVGYVTGLMAEKVGPTGRVLAFEPDPVNFRLASHTIATNRWAHVDARQAACGEAAGMMPLFRDPDNWGNHSLARDEERHSAGSTQVEVVTLDEAAADLDRLDVMKIDVQGWELSVLRGATTLRRHRPTLFTEFFPRGLRAAGTDPADLWEELATWGRIEQVCSDGTTTPVTLADAVGNEREAYRNVDLVVRPN